MERTKTKVDMKKIILTILAALLANIANAQKMIVYSLSGKVEDVSSSTTRPVRLRDALSPNTVLNIPYEGCVVLYDANSSQQYTLKKPGRATVKEMIADNHNSIKKLTGDYLAFIKKQITGGGQILVRNCSDPATVTRELGVAADYNDNLAICGTDGYSDFSNSTTDSYDEFTKRVKNSYQIFTKKVIAEYRNFRDSIMNDYAESVRNPWKKVMLTPPEKKPEDEKIKPTIITRKDGKLVNADFDKHKTAAIEKIDLSVYVEENEEEEEEEIVPLKVDDIGKVIVPDFNKNNNKPEIGIVKPIEIDGNLQPLVEEEEKEIAPLIIDEKTGKPIIPNFGKSAIGKVPEMIVSVLPLPQPLPTPESIIPIQCLENKKSARDYYSFVYYGTKMEVRWSDDCRFHLNGITENNIADGIQLLSDSKYDNLLHDCLQLRESFNLGDWAYYQMLKQLTSDLCGKDTNEATLLMAMLYSQSGYRQRLARSGEKLLQLVATQFYLYDYAYYILDGHNFYLLDGDFKELYLCQSNFNKEQEMSLVMNDSPSFINETSEDRTITSFFYNIKADVSVNKNLMDFYSRYPSSHFNNDFMTRWAMYANKEMQPEVCEQLYPQLKAIIAGKSQKESAECILNWIQTAFKYEYDDVVWGHDRAFFPEESLYYPYCDCEDRSILYTRLVRDLLGLKCILVYYPGHLASGVCFNENVDGDYIEVEGNRYIICDPTIISGTPVGWTMRGMNNNEAKVIVLE